MSDTEISKYEEVVRPDYDTLSFEPPRAEQPSTVSEKKKLRGNRDIRLLAIVASVLFLLAAVALLLMSRGILLWHDGGLAFRLSVDRPADPFRPASEETVLSDETQSGKINIDISDPPEVGPDSKSDDRSMSISEISEKVSPSVVAVLSTGVTGVNSATGTVITEGNYVVTSAAAVRWASLILVATSDGERYQAQLVGMDVGSDVAVLSVTAEALTCAECGNADAMQVGDTLVSVSAETDSGVYLSVSAGIVSSVARDYVRGGRQMSLLRTDISFSGGLAGAPVFNSYGQVVGMLTASIDSDSGFSTAISMNTVKTVVEELLQGEETGEQTDDLSLGIEAVFLNSARAAASGMPVGLLVTAVDTEGLFSKAGLVTGDVIESVNDVRITDMAAFLAEVKKISAGDDVSLLVYRDSNPNDGTAGNTVDLNFTAF